jgi:uncharacterized protein (DUF1778 family)
VIEIAPKSRLTANSLNLAIVNIDRALLWLLGHGVRDLNMVAGFARGNILVAIFECESLNQVAKFNLYAIVIHMVQINSTSVLSVRVSSAEKAMLEAASEGARTNLSDFVRRASLEAAELSMLSRNIVSIPAQRWEEFEAWVSRPPVKNLKLQELANKKPTWAK